MDIKVSVIIPVYNVEKYLEKCLNSILNQTLYDIEIIAVDDCSTDNSWKILEEYKNKFSKKMIIIRSAENGRQGTARNIGIKKANGKYIIFVDSDDWIKEDMIEKLYQCAENKQSDMVGVLGYVRSYSNGKQEEVLSERADKIKKMLEKPFTDEQRNYLLFSGIGVTQHIYKREFLIENQIFFPEKLSYEDNFFVPLCFALVKKYSVIDGAYYYYRENLDSTVFRNDTSQMDRLIIERKRYMEFQKRGLLLNLHDGYEIMSIKTFYINTVNVIFRKFNRQAVAEAKKVKKEFYQMFPEFRKNKYFKNEISKKEKIKLMLMEICPSLLGVLLYVNFRKGKR